MSSSHEPISIRPLERADLNEAATIHLAAFRDSSLTALGRKAVYRYYDWQLTGPHDVVALGAFQDSKLLGFCFGGVFRGAMSGYLRRNRLFLAGTVMTRPWLLTNSIFLDRLRFGIRILNKLKKTQPAPSAPSPTQAQTQTKEQTQKPFGILAIAVRPQAQNHGTGKLLMLEIERIAREKQFRELHLSVHTDNHQAIGFYERLGWQRIPTDSGAEWNGKMSKPLLLMS